MVRQLLLVIGLGIALIKTGTEGAELWRRHPVLRTCAQLQGDTSDATWLELHLCKPDPMAGVVALGRFDGENVRGAWVPLRADGPPGSPIVAILKTRDPGLLALLDRLRSLPDPAPPEEVNRIIRNSTQVIGAWSRVVNVAGRSDPLESFDAEEVHRAWGDRVSARTPVITPGPLGSWSAFSSWLAVAVVLSLIMVFQMRQAHQAELPPELRPSEEPQLGELEAIRREEAEQKKQSD